MVTSNPQRGVTLDRGNGDVVLAGSWQDGVRSLYGWNTGHNTAVFATPGARVTMIAPDGLPLVPLDFRDQVDAARMRDRVDAAERVLWARRGSRTTVDLDRRAAGGKPPVRLGDTIRFKLRWTPMNGERLARLQDRDKALAGGAGARAIETLRAGLLAFGGDYVNVLGYDEEIPVLLLRGQLWNGRGATVEPGARSRCHANAARLMVADPASTLVATGYALSEDGLWREHSWGIRVDPGSPKARVIETTTPRVAYFGFALADAEARRFAEANP